MRMWKENSRLRFRATELTRLTRLGVTSMICLAAGVLAACEQTTAGTVVRASGTTTTTHPDPAEPVPGVVPTLPDHIPPNALACFPTSSVSGRMTAAAVPDRAAPRLTVSLPDRWRSVAGDGDRALTLTGPDGMSGVVTIAATDLEPGGAFLKYAVAMRDSRPGVKFTVAAAQFCGYSSQMLTGTFQGSSGTFDFVDRLTHIWTNTKKYLVTIQLQSPVGAAGFDASKDTLMQQFAVVIP
jgi:hypothetical protein